VWCMASVCMMWHCIVWCVLSCLYIVCFVLKASCFGLYSVLHCTHLMIRNRYIVCCATVCVVSCVLYFLLYVFCVLFVLWFLRCVAFHVSYVTLRHCCKAGIALCGLCCMVCAAGYGILFIVCAVF